MTEEELRRQIVATCRLMNARGVNQGSSGNLSARWGEGLLITPSGMDYDLMQPGDIVAMAWDGSWTGDRRPSSEWRFHRDILAARPEVGAVLHCHSVAAAAVACHLRPIPAFHYMVAMMGGHDLRCAPYATFGTQELSDLAIAALADRRACLLGQHGQIALGATPAAALAMAVEVETLARMYLEAHRLGPPPVLPAAEMDRVIAQMNGLGYGQGPKA